jgi:hypothetical protein
MPNKVVNLIVFPDQTTAKEILTKFQKDGEEYGSLDFNKILPVPCEFSEENEEISQTAVNVFLTAVNPDTEDIGIEKFDQEAYDMMHSIIQKKRGTVPVIDSIPYESMQDISQKYFSDFEKGKGRYGDDIITYGKIIAKSIVESGISNHIEWKFHRWGTAHNSTRHASMENDSCIAIVETERFSPIGIFIELSKRCHSEKLFVFSYSDNKPDEITKYIFENGKLVATETGESAEESFAENCEKYGLYE